MGRKERKPCCRCHEVPKASNRSYCVECWADVARERRAKRKVGPKRKVTWEESQALLYIMIPYAEGDQSFYDTENKVYALFGFLPPGI